MSASNIYPGGSLPGSGLSITTLENAVIELTGVLAGAMRATQIDSIQPPDTSIERVDATTTLDRPTRTSRTGIIAVLAVLIAALAGSGLAARMTPVHSVETPSPTPATAPMDPAPPTGTTSTF